MQRDTSYFFSGIGGSGMMPLALIMRAQGHAVAGSDRALDQGMTAAKFAFLESQGISLYKQDGSGIVSATQILVTSAAVEDTVPDVVAARRLGCQELRRAALLSQLFNAAPTSIGVAGTSGKSTTTAMIAWILSTAGRNPTVINGAVMKNYITPQVPFAGAVVGGQELFVAEVDESDGSIAAYNPTVAVINNIAEDHKSMEELRILFAGFKDRATHAVLNLDNAETSALAARTGSRPAITFSLRNTAADFLATDLVQHADGVTAILTHQAQRFPLRLQTPGAHNMANALAAIAAVSACGVPPHSAVQALEQFTGVKRRLEVIGTKNGVTVIDDFAHNPDKIAATLATLRATPGRLLIFFQPHGYGPLRLMRQGFAGAFAEGLHKEDLLILPDPAYFGGTTERSVTSADLVQDMAQMGVDARHLPSREEAKAVLTGLLRPGDRVVVMGARDDTLTEFARDILASV